MKFIKMKIVQKIKKNLNDELKKNENRLFWLNFIP